MGFLVLKDTGSYQVNVNNTTGIISYTAETTVNNPSVGYVNLKPFKFSFNLGVRVDNAEDLSNLTPRITRGGRLPISLQIDANYDRKVTDRTTETGLSPVDIIDTVINLTKFAKKGTVLLLYWMTNDTTQIINGQCMDYYSSSMRVQTETEWEIATGVFPSLTAGTSGSLIGTYAPKVLPIIINKVTVNEVSGTSLVKVQVDSNLVTKEL